MEKEIRYERIHNYLIHKTLKQRKPNYIIEGCILRNKSKKFITKNLVANLEEKGYFGKTQE